MGNSFRHSRSSSVKRFNLRLQFLRAPRLRTRPFNRPLQVGKALAEVGAPYFIPTGLEHVVVRPAALQALLIVLFGDYQLAHDPFGSWPRLLLFLVLHTLL